MIFKFKLSIVYIYLILFNFLGTWFRFKWWSFCNGRNL